MNADLVLSIALIASCSLLVTSHCALAFGLIAKRPTRRLGLLCLVPPAGLLAPYWAYRAGLRWQAGAWVASLVTYLAALALALRPSA